MFTEQNRSRDTNADLSKVSFPSLQQDKKIDPKIETLIRTLEITPTENRLINESKTDAEKNNQTEQVSKRQIAVLGDLKKKLDEVASNPEMKKETEALISAIASATTKGVSDSVKIVAIQSLEKVNSAHAISEVLHGATKLDPSKDKAVVEAIKTYLDKAPVPSELFNVLEKLITHGGVAEAPIRKGAAKLLCRMSITDEKAVNVVLKAFKDDQDMSVKTEVLNFIEQQGSPKFLLALVSNDTLRKLPPPMEDRVIAVINNKLNSTGVDPEVKKQIADAINELAERGALNSAKFTFNLVKSNPEKNEEIIRKVAERPGIAPDVIVEADKLLKDVDSAREARGTPEQAIKIGELLQKAIGSNEQEALIAIKELVQMKPTAAKVALADIIGVSPHVNVKEAAAAALKGVNNDVVVAKILNHLQHKDGTIRLSALKALEGTQNPSAQAILVGMLSTAKNDVGYVFQALNGNKSTEVSRAIAGLVTSDDPWKRYFATKYIVDTFPESSPLRDGLLASVLRDNRNGPAGYEPREVAARGLAGTKEMEAILALKGRLVEHGAVTYNPVNGFCTAALEPSATERERLEVVQALSHLVGEDPGVTNAMRFIAQNSDLRTRASSDHARNLIDKLDIKISSEEANKVAPPHSSSDVMVKLATLKSDGAAVEARIEAMISLSKLDQIPNDLIPILRSIISLPPSSDQNLRTTAIRSLGRINNEAAVDALAGIFSSDRSLETRYQIGLAVKGNLFAYKLLDPLVRDSMPPYAYIVGDIVNSAAKNKEGVNKLIDTLVKHQGNFRALYIPVEIERALGNNRPLNFADVNSSLNSSYPIDKLKGAKQVILEKNQGGTDIDLPMTRPAILPNLKSDNFAVKIYSLQALGAPMDEYEVRLFISMLNDEAVGVREAASTGLKILKGNQGLSRYAVNELSSMNLWDKSAVNAVISTLK